jgi:hypothetical protein
VERPDGRIFPAVAVKPGFFITLLDQYVSAGRLDGYAHTLGRDIAAGLAANGWPCEAVAPWIDPHLKAVFEGGLPPFVLAFNLYPDTEIDINLHTGKPEKALLFQVLHDFLKVPVICILCDHAAYHLEYFARYQLDSDGSPKYPSSSDGIAFAPLEPSSFHFLGGIAVPPSKMICLPWGGPPPAPDPKPFKDRAYQLVFQGSLEEPESKQKFIKRYTAEGTSLPVARAMSRAAERVVEENEDIHVVVLAEMRKEDIDPTRLDIFAKMVAHVDRRSRTIRRDRFLSAFAKLPVHFFGNYPEKFRRKFPQARFHGLKAFGEMAEVAGNAKMALCESINWRENVDLRPPYSMAQGCLVVAEKSNLRLGRDFTDMKNIVLSAHPYRDAAKKVEAILADPRLGQDMTEAAKPIYQSRYTWRETVKALAPFLPPPAR